ncbi:hypothetical protein JCM10207_003212 [Rhodosporidiobolus poonsookiae]
MSSLKNYAAWLKEPHARLVVDEAPTYEPAEGEVLVKVHAISIQPLDWKIQTNGAIGPDYPLSYPFILGTDSAGVVEAVGTSVTHVKKGDRVLSYHATVVTGRAREGAFQHYAIANADLVAPFPPSTSFEEAAVLPLSLSTVADGLYQPHSLDLPLPLPEVPQPSTQENGKGKVLLVWGASSSVGATAVQLAVASGVQVVATASPSNFALAKALGACAVVDYGSPTVVEDLVAALLETGDEFAGAFDAIGEGGTVEKCAEGLEARWMLCPDPAYKNGGALARAIYHDFVPRALETGVLKCKPDPLPIEGKGLEVLQKAVDRAKEGVSARKVVVRIV